MLKVRVLSQFKKIALDCLFPQICLFCRKNTEKDRFALICGGCFSKISFASAVFCPRCFRRRPKATNCPSCAPKLHIKILAAAASYEDEKIRTLIHKLKYDRLKELAHPLAEFLINYLRLAAPRWCRDKSLTLIPVPLHKRKENWRGFNQSELIGKIIAGDFGWHFENSALARTRNNPAQVDLKSFEERRENVKNLFAVKKPEVVKNKKIVLIDDVFTSGATLSECARVLKTAGAKRIYGLVIARG